MSEPDTPRTDPTLEVDPLGGHLWPDGATLKGEPRVNHIWAAVDTFAEYLELEDNRPPHPNRELWYVTTLTIRDAYRVDALCRHYGIDTVADLGAGDCRLALWLDREGYDVVAYELNTELVTALEDRFWFRTAELRHRDYYGDFDQLVGPDRAVVAFGGTNELPYVPDEGLAVQGYWDKGITAWHDGEEVARW